MSMRIPPVAAVILGLHLAWGAVVLLLPRLDGDVAAAAPFLAALWFGTSAMLLVGGLVVGSTGWQHRQSAALAALLLFNVAGALLVLRLALSG